MIPVEKTFFSFSGGLQYIFINAFRFSFYSNYIGMERTVLEINVLRFRSKIQIENDI